jgi:cytochrome c oxidase assembly protein subunit 15
LHRFSVFVTFTTLLLVMAGALVTSNDAGGAIPDWPLSWGKLVPPLEGGIVYAYAHRVLAASVGVLTFVLAIGTGFWLPFGLVAAQAVVGGLAVLLVLPKAMVLVHACLAQLCFGALVWQAAGVPGKRARFAEFAERAGRGPAALIAVVALFAQTILGAAVRHGLAGPIPHIAGAIVATLIVLWAVVPAMMEHMAEAGALLALTAFQILLGMGAYFARSLEAPQPLPMMVWITAAHVAVGSLAFGAAIVLALVVYWREPSESGMGGMAVA